MTDIFSFLYAPLGWILRTIYELVGNYGVSLLIFTFIIRLFLLPTSIGQQKGQAKQMRLQPKIKKIQQKYAGNQMKINEEMQALYSREGYSSMTAGCLPLLLQMPIMFGLIGVIYKPLTYVLHIPAEIVEQIVGAADLSQASSRASYAAELLALNQKETILTQLPDLAAEYVQKIQDLKFTFLGLPLGEVPNVKNFSVLWIIPIASCLSALAMSLYSFLRQRKTNPEMAKNPMMGCTMLMSPMMSLWFGFVLPVGIGFYWIASSLIAFGQMVLLNYTHSPKKIIAKMMVNETIQRRSKEATQKAVVRRRTAAEE